MERTIKALICTQTDSRFIRQTKHLIMGEKSYPQSLHPFTFPYSSMFAGEVQSFTGVHSRFHYSKSNFHYSISEYAYS